MPVAAAAQDAPPFAMSPEFARAMQPMVERAAATDRVVVTRHRVTIAGRRIRYRAIVSEFPLAGANGKPAAVAVTYAYVADAPAGTTPRPVLFVFNGGPGASSLPLHLNGIGPRRVAGKGAAAHLVDNQASPLDVADLVFIDPVGTGASMPVKGGDATGFFSVDGDAKEVIDIIARWSAANGKVSAPKLLMGESYGTTRAAAILGQDAKDHRIDARGVILTSLAFGGTDERVTAPMAMLPTYAAVAWYHNRIDRAGHSVEQHVAAARAFATGDYAAALIKGDTLDDATRAKVAARMSALIGIPAATLAADRLVIEADAFMAQLLGGGLRTGRLDARVTRAIAASQAHPPFDDPSMSLGGEKGDLLTPYLRNELNYVPPSPYRSLNLGINFKWDYGRGGYGALALEPSIAAARRSRPHLKVMSIGGYYDITTPFYAGVYALDHTGMPAGDRTTGFYPSGHSVLEDEQAGPRAAEDIRGFIRRAVAD